MISWTIKKKKKKEKEHQISNDSILIFLRFSNEFTSLLFIAEYIKNSWCNQS